MELQKNKVQQKEDEMLDQYERELSFQLCQSPEVLEKILKHSKEYLSQKVWKEEKEIENLNKKTNEEFDIL